MKIPILDDLFQLFRGENRRPTLIVLLSVVMIVAWRTAGTQGFYHRHLAHLAPDCGDPAEVAAWYQMAMGLLLLGILPAGLVRLVFGESLASVGLGTGSLKAAIVLIALTAPFILWISHDSATVAEFRDVYPFNRSAGVSGRSFAVHVASLALLYLGWEFHFRGFLQQGLAASVGSTAGLWVQVLASCLLHFGRPDVEIWASIPAGLLWGLQANYTKAIWAGFAQHWLLGAALDYCICFS